MLAAGRLVRAVVLVDVCLQELVGGFHLGDLLLEAECFCLLDAFEDVSDQGHALVEVFLVCRDVTFGGVAQHELSLAGERAVEYELLISDCYFLFLSVELSDCIHVDVVGLVVADQLVLDDLVDALD